MASTLLLRALKSLRALIQISLVIISDPEKPIRKLERLTAKPKNKKIIKILSALEKRLNVLLPILKNYPEIEYEYDCV